MSLNYCSITTSRPPPPPAGGKTAKNQKKKIEGTPLNCIRGISFVPPCRRGEFLRGTTVVPRCRKEFGKEPSVGNFEADPCSPCACRRAVDVHVSVSGTPSGPHAGVGEPFLKIEQETRFIFLSVKPTTIVSDILLGSQLCNLKHVFFFFLYRAYSNYYVLYKSSFKQE